jgi:hypothetical protein
VSTETSISISLRRLAEVLVSYDKGFHGAVSTKPSFADPGSFFRIPDPDFYPSLIPDPTTATKEEGGKISCFTFFVATNVKNIEIILFLNW